VSKVDYELGVGGLAERDVLLKKRTQVRAGKRWTLPQHGNNILHAVQVREGVACTLTSLAMAACVQTATVLEATLGDLRRATDLRKNGVFVRALWPTHQGAKDLERAGNFLFWILEDFAAFGFILVQP
jgi:hypothetical protein